LNHSNIALLNAAFGSGDQSGAGLAQPVGASSDRRIQFSLDHEFWLS
jgi:hypothetical protein